MKKRQGILILVCALMLALTLTGCGGDKPPAQSNAGQGEAPDHEHGEYEWIGEFEFEAGDYLFHFGASEDETMDVGFIKMGANVVDLEDYAAHLMLTEKEIIKEGSEFVAKPEYAYTFEMNDDHGHINFTIEEAGTYAIITEHMPFESNMQIFDADNVEILPIREHEAADHEH